MMMMIKIMFEKILYTYASENIIFLVEQVWEAGGWETKNYNLIIQHAEKITTV